MVAKDKEVSLDWILFGRHLDAPIGVGEDLQNPYGIPPDFVGRVARLRQASESMERVLGPNPDHLSSETVAKIHQVAYQYRLDEAGIEMMDELYRLGVKHGATR